MSGQTTPHAFWQALWSLYDAAMAHGVDPASLTPARSANSKVRTSPAAVMLFAAEFYDLELTELVGQSRARHLIEPRALAAWGLRNASEHWSFTAIGRAMGGRDHTTIINLVRRAEQFRSQSPNFLGACEDLRRAFHIQEEGEPCASMH